MPKYFEFVFAAYAIWIGVFVFYFAHLYLRTRRTARTLAGLGARKDASPASPPPPDAP